MMLLIISILLLWASRRYYNTAQKHLLIHHADVNIQMAMSEIYFFCGLISMGLWIVLTVYAAAKGVL